MAKVYDALLRLEKDRSQQAQRRHAPPPEPPVPAWRRWFRTPTVTGGVRQADSAAQPLDERLNLIIARLDALQLHPRSEHPHNGDLAPVFGSLEAVERALSEVRTRLDDLEADTSTHLATLAEHLMQRESQLNKKLSVLLVALVAIALLLLLR